MANERQDSAEDYCQREMIYLKGYPKGMANGYPKGMGKGSHNGLANGMGASRQAPNRVQWYTSHR
jgi:hypothetical protein